MVRRVIFLVLLGICLTTIASVAVDTDKKQAAETISGNHSR